MTLRGCELCFGCFSSKDDAVSIIREVKDDVFKYYEKHGKIPRRLTTIDAIKKYKKDTPTNDQMKERAVLGGIASGKVWTDAKIQSAKRNILKARESQNSRTG